MLDPRKDAAYFVFSFLFIFLKEQCINAAPETQKGDLSTLCTLALFAIEKGGEMEEKIEFFWV